jgi:hypothetical protein
LHECLLFSHIKFPRVRNLLFDPQTENFSNLLNF